MNLEETKWLESKQRSWIGLEPREEIGDQGRTLESSFLKRGIQVRGAESR